MPKIVSPTHFKGELDHFYDPTFTADISQKMQVPKSIRVTGGGDMDDQPAQPYTLLNERFDMHVPDRIIIMEGDQHIGAKSQPREIMLENSLMGNDTEYIRIQTPPRVITMDDHYFPSMEDYPRNTPPDQDSLGAKYDSPSGTDMNQLASFKSRHNEHDQSLIHRDWTPAAAGGDGSNSSAEIMHLRRQLAKLNRRVMAVELDNLQMQQREKMLYASVAAYLLYKFISWLSHS